MFGKKKPVTNSATKRKKKVIMPFVSKYPEINFEELRKVEQVKLNIKLEGDKSDFTYFEISVDRDITFNQVARIINKRNNFSCKNIRLFVEIDSKKNCLDNVMTKTFEEMDILANQEITFLYQYEPIQHPLLEASLN